MDVRPVWAREGDVVEIHWRLEGGLIEVERRTCPEQDRPKGYHGEFILGEPSSPPKIDP